MFKFPEHLHGNGLLRSATPRRHARRHARLVVVGLGLALLAAMFGDSLWAALEEGAVLVFDFVADSLETFFRKACGLSLRYAQMATAYVIFTFFLLTGLMLMRKLLAWARRVREDSGHWWHAHLADARAYSAEKGRIIQAWWDRLDWLNKSAVVVSVILAAIPLALLLSMGLGMAVVEFL